MSVRLAVAGWSLFIAENVILSENRTKIIELLEDDKEEVCVCVCIFSGLQWAAVGCSGFGCLVYENEGD